MKRALILITVLSVLCLTLAIAVDLYQSRTADSYLSELPALREALINRDLVDAYAREALLHARWQHDETRMNSFINHHHTRSVTVAFRTLATAIEQGWIDEALRALDLVSVALIDVQGSDFYKWENFF